MISWMVSARGRRRIGAVALLGVAWAMAGCGALQRKHEPQPGIVDPHQPKELEMVSMPPYVIEPPDEIEVSVRPTSLEVLLTNVTVRADGVIDLGFVGDVYVAGLTLEQAEQKIAQHLEPLAERRKVREPIDVSVRLVNGQSKFYYVVGSVTTQGKFPIIGNENVLDAILAATLRSNSMPEKAYLVRPHPPSGGDQILRIDWEGITKRGDTMTNYQLFPGDRIVVPGGKKPGLLGSLLGG